MPRENRVRPDGQLAAVPERGLCWGNRGCLVDDRGELARYSRGRNWIICVLQFKGRRRTQWQPRRLTELYFLDEATGLAAGHRPCGECRRGAYRRFTAAWRAAHPDDPAGADPVDRRLHHDRLVAPGVRRTYLAGADVLPDATMIQLDGRPWLVRGDDIQAWTFGGYGTRRSRSGLGAVTVLTPRSTVATLAAGYRPEVHPSASGST